MCMYICLLLVYSSGVHGMYVYIHVSVIVYKNKEERVMMEKIINLLSLAYSVYTCTWKI